MMPFAQFVQRQVIVKLPPRAREMNCRLDQSKMSAAPFAVVDQLCYIGVSMVRPFGFVAATERLNQAGRTSVGRPASNG